MAEDTEAERQRLDDEIASVIPPARTLSGLVAYLGDNFDKLCGEQLQTILTEVENRAIDGHKEVKFKIKLGLAVRRGNDGVYEITPSFDIDLPKLPNDRTIMWVDRTNNFTPANPRQMNMQFRTVTTGRGVRTIT